MESEIMVYLDPCRDPPANLAKEERLFQMSQRGEIPNLLRFWANTTCLVRGKARTARYGWYDEELAQSLGVPVFERSTGGGAVYHDRGNLNWSFYLENSGAFPSPTKVFGMAAGYMVGALKELGVNSSFMPPNRIDAYGRKVSGMAARTSPKSLLVHGTLLLSSDLKMLDRLCIPPEGCPPVANLNEWVPGIGENDVVKAAVSVFRRSGFVVSMGDPAG